LRFADTLAGKKVRCPMCQAVIEVPASGRRILASADPIEADAIQEENTTGESRPRRAAVPERFPGERYGEDHAALARRIPEKGSSNTLLVVGLIVGGVLLVGCIGVGAICLVFLASEPDTEPIGIQASPPDGPKGPNLLVNGNFEEGPNPENGQGFVNLQAGSNAIKGWVVSRGDIDYKGSFWQPAEGQRSLDLNGWTKGGIAQTFKTTKGKKYRVTFSMAGNPHPEEPRVKRMVVSAAGTSAEFSFDTLGRTFRDMGWVTKTWDFVAVADQTTLEFYSLTGQACGPALDDVRVVALDQ
jgi:choice-of-anchor C domain-containing protein